MGNIVGLYFFGIKVRMSINTNKMEGSE